jgi:hypothetical protein
MLAAFCHASTQRERAAGSGCRASPLCRLLAYAADASAAAAVLRAAVSMPPLPISPRQRRAADYFYFSLPPPCRRPLAAAIRHCHAAPPPLLMPLPDAALPLMPLLTCRRAFSFSIAYSRFAAEAAVC